MSGFFVPEATKVYTSAVAASHTGNTNETTLATVTIPGGLLQANSVIEIQCLWRALMTVNSNVPTARLYFGGVLYGDWNVRLNTPSLDMTREFCRTIYCNNSVAAQKSANLFALDPAEEIDAAMTTSSVNTASDVNIVFKGLLDTSGDTIRLEGYRIKLNGV